VIVDKNTKTILATNYASGKTHDFKLYKQTRLVIPMDIKKLTDMGYKGLQKLAANVSMPKRKSKNKPLTKEEKLQNREISKERVVNEHVIGLIKRFKIVADRYRNRRKRFGLRFNLIAGIHNFELNI